MKQKNEVPKKKVASDIHGLFKMKVGEEKDFMLSGRSHEDAKKIYNKLKFSASYYGTTYARRYPVRKLVNEANKKIVRVYRTV